MKSNTSSKLNALAKGIHMGEEVFEYYSKMAKDTRLRDSLIEIHDNYEEYCVELGKELNISIQNNDLDNNYLNMLTNTYKKFSDISSSNDIDLKNNALSALESAMEISREFLANNVIENETSYNIIENFIDDNRILFNQIDAIEINS